MEDVFINKVAESGIITLDPTDYLTKEAVMQLDLKEYLFMGLIIKEKDFRLALKEQDWSSFANAHVAITCTADAIIPAWAYMLLQTYLQPIAKSVYMGSEAELKKKLNLSALETITVDEFLDKRIVLKGCGDVAIPDYMYAQLTYKLMPVAKSIMYGEPCSTVPVYKKRN